MNPALHLDLIDLGDARNQTKGWGRPIAEIHPPIPVRNVGWAM
jgi:hypothetical protein